MGNEANARAPLADERAGGYRVFAKPRMGRLAVWHLVLFALIGSSPRTSWTQSKADEYHVKAAFLFHFAQLVEWPAASFGGGNSFDLCTLGDDPFQGELERTVEGKRIGARILHIRHLSELQVARGCHMVFISKSEDKRLAAMLAGVRGSPVLTVGEADNFLGSGGMIRLCLEGNKVRFEINREAAESAGLRISATLLLLARNLTGGSGEH